MEMRRGLYRRKIPLRCSGDDVVCDGIPGSDTACHCKPKSAGGATGNGQPGMPGTTNGQLQSGGAGGPANGGGQGGGFGGGAGGAAGGIGSLPPTQQDPGTGLAGTRSGFAPQPIQGGSQGVQGAQGGGTSQFSSSPLIPG